MKRSEIGANKISKRLLYVALIFSMVIGIMVPTRALESTKKYVVTNEDNPDSPEIIFQTDNADDLATYIMNFDSNVEKARTVKLTLNENLEFLEQRESAYLSDLLFPESKNFILEGNNHIIKKLKVRT